MKTILASTLLAALAGNATVVDVEPRQIAETKVLATMMDGRFTYKIETPPEESREFADRKSSRWSY